jgi:hypothetical protein
VANQPITYHAAPAACCGRERSRRTLKAIRRGSSAWATGEAMGKVRAVATVARRLLLAVAAKTQPNDCSELRPQSPHSPFAKKQAAGCTIQQL